MQEDVQTPEREQEMKAAMRDALAVTRQAVVSGNRREALDSWENANRIIDRHKRERDDPNTVYGKDGRVVRRTVTKPRRRVQEGILKGLDGKTVTLLGAMAAGAGAGGALNVHQNALDRFGQAHVAQLDAQHDATDAYHRLQQTADAKRKANAPAIAPGFERPVTTKPRRRLEETLVEYYKQRLEEMRVDPPMLRAMRSGAAELKKQAMTKRIAAEREAEKARQAGMTDAERDAEHVERLRERDRRNFAASLAVNTAVHQQRSGGGS